MDEGYLLKKRRKILEENSYGTKYYDICFEVESLQQCGNYLSCLGDMTVKSRSVVIVLM